MAIVKAQNGNVLDLPDDIAAILVAEGAELLEGTLPEPVVESEDHTEPEPVVEETAKPAAKK